MAFSCLGLASVGLATSVALVVGCAAGAQTGDAGPSGSIEASSTPESAEDGEAGRATGDSVVTVPLPDGNPGVSDPGAEASAPTDARADAASTDAGSRDAAGSDATVSDVGAPDAPAKDGAAADARHEAATKDAGGCALAHLLVSQVQSRGAGGASDEFVELYNPSAVAVTLDSTWEVEARSNTASSFGSRWKGTGLSIAPLGHYLVAGTAYSLTPSPDGALTDGISDASSVELVHGGVTVDTVCYAYSTSTSSALTSDPSYGCPGTPAANSHDDTASTDTTSSLERAPGGVLGNCGDTGDSAHDFHVDTPSVPRDRASAPAP